MTESRESESDDSVREAKWRSSPALAKEPASKLTRVIGRMDFINIRVRFPIKCHTYYNSQVILNIYIPEQDHRITVLPVSIGPFRLDLRNSGELGNPPDRGRKQINTYDKIAEGSRDAEKERDKFEDFLRDRRLKEDNSRRRPAWNHAENLKLFRKTKNP